jgi:hypothetical protein
MAELSDMMIDDGQIWPTNDTRASNLGSSDQELRINFEQALMKGGGFVKIIELSRDTLEVCWNMFQPSRGDFCMCTQYT